MATKQKKLIDADYREPMVIFPLKQYEALMDRLEEAEDRLAVLNRADEPDLSLKEVEALYNRKRPEK
jgi:hypothetical protein